MIRPLQKSGKRRFLEDSKKALNLSHLRVEAGSQFSEVT